MMKNIDILHNISDIDVILPCKAKKQYLLTLRINVYRNAMYFENCWSVNP